MFIFVVESKYRNNAAKNDVLVYCKSIAKQKISMKWAKIVLSDLWRLHAKSQTSRLIIYLSERENGTT